ncbi:Unsaturated glucuronyl hydrolase [Hyphodiscus hymeniophilus]|uniref:Unsaturated glucuronyl hydrolase n=1 Tax=Hyphodiscus hymeniophilus TaxID=353542 RepID=A0A9P6SMX4_9HELO|nr:Unsaturated glucuronyl hydrolase [Hyphodiscus hymeniophilus]
MDMDDESSASTATSVTGTETTASSVSSPPATKGNDVLLGSRVRLDLELAELFSENVAAKIWRVAAGHLEQEDALANYPEFIPTEGPTAGKYTTKFADFWTCGFFPGSLYALLERTMKYPKYLPSSNFDRLEFQAQLLELCRTWSDPLHRMAKRTNTHDLGFIVQPALRMDWELTGNTRSFQSVVTAANSLSSRYNEKLGAIRSWDQCHNTKESITDKETNFLIIIDSMCNLDLLFYVGHHTSNQRMVEIATSHALVVLRSIVRDDFSTYHLANLDPETGNIKVQRTHQGGQGWGILGFTQTYVWTKNPIFLDAAINMANYFLDRLAISTHSYPYVPVWDFDAPVPRDTPPLRDTSAGMIAANGLVLLHQILNNNSPYLAAAIQIAKETVDLSLSLDKARFSIGHDGRVAVEKGTFDGILMNATANNNELAVKRYSDHGLVYADYYFLELGNKLLRMGLV